ncbi:MAG: conjugal transfer protein TraF [Methyloprofundus sp.]|nr:conjugal transfer protein TraF [Methyloprofundus sp.]
MKFFLVFLLLSLLAPFAVYASSVSDYRSALDCQGKDSFNWYCIEEKKKDDVAPEEPLVTPAPPSAPHKDEASPLTYEEEMLNRFDEMVERLESLKRIAIVEPTHENVRNYISYQLEIQNKAAVFTDAWKRVQWQDPALDYSTRFTMNNIGKQEEQRVLRDAQQNTLAELSELGWGVWFFYSSTCSFCHRMTPSINLINSQGLSVLPVSIDHNPLQGLDMGYFKDQGQAQELGVTMTPSLFLVNQNTRLVVPVAFGIISYQELVRRIHTIVKTEPGDNF